MRRGSWYTSLYFAVILVISLLLSISLGGAQCLADNWTKTAQGGLEGHNYRASPMAVLGNTLYAGTASTVGAELWKNTGSGWTAAGTAGFGDTQNLQVSSLATYNAKLYLGTMNAKTGGQVFSYDGSSSVQFIGAFSPVNKDVASMAAYGGYLFAGTQSLTVWYNFFPGCKVFRYDGSTWPQEGASGFGDGNNLIATSMCAYGDSLYVATRNVVTGCEVWKRNPAGTWQQVNVDGFGSASNLDAPSMAVFNGSLYVGTMGTTGRLWKYDGSTWSQAGPDGLGESINMAVSSLAVFDNALYAGTEAATGGTGQLWRSTNGTQWTKAAANGFGEVTNAAVCSLAAFDSRIFAGTQNETKGCEIWSSLGLPGSIQSASPTSGSRGQTLGVLITGSGTHFAGGISVATFSGTGITVNSTSIADATHATANITIADNASASARDVNVITAQDTPVALASGFAVLDPRITAVSPDSAFQGDTVELNITGADTHFAGGSSQATVSGPGVTVNSTTVVDSTHVKASITVGHDALTGARDVNVVTAGMTTRPLENGLSVKTGLPRLDSVTLPYGMIGDTVTLKGDWFGSTRLSSRVTFNGKPATAYSLWSGTEIQCQVPAGATSGPVVVTTAAGSSAGKPFQVVNTMPGDKVSVNLGNGVVVVFDHVTAPGNTGASVISNPSIKDYFAVGGASRNIATTAGFSGKVRVTMSYAGASLLRYQKDNLALLHEEGGQWVNVTSGRNSDAKTVTGQVTSLSRFAIAIPSDVFVPAAATWYLAEGTTDWGFDTRISIENPNNRVVTAQVTYMTNSGKVQRPNIKLPAMSQTTLNPAADLGNRDFSTEVVCLEGEIIAVDRTMTWTGPGAASPEAHSSIGVTRPAATWYLPEGSSKWGFETWVLVQNPNDKPATCNLTYMIEGAKSVTVQKTVPANSRASFDISKDIGQQDASIKVESADSAVQLIAERAMYRNNRREGAASIGANTPDNDYYLAEGTTGWGFTTYVLVQNPNDQAADVALTFMTGSGQVQGPSVSMPANSRKTFKINDILPGQDFSTRVHGNMPIVAERAMYWDNGTGEASHDSIGEAGAHRVFLLPDGETTIGWETWTLVQNPNPAPVKIEVSYLTASGDGDIVFTDTLAANSRKSYNMGTKMMNQRASVMVKSKTTGKNIMVERSMYWNNRGAGTCTIGGYTN